MTTTRSLLYRAARVLGDVNAVRRGPRATAKRLVRRSVYRNVNRSTARVLRGFGL